MSREKELIKNTIILAIGRFLPKMIAIVTLPIVTAKLTKNEYGTYDLITTLIMLLLPIATLQIQSAAFRFLIDCRGDREKSAVIISNIMLVTVPVSIVVSTGLIIFMPHVSFSARIAIGVYFLADILNQTVSQIARGLNMNIVYSVNSVIISFVNGLGIILALQLMSTGLTGVIISLAIANFAGLIYIFKETNLTAYLRIRFFSREKTVEMLNYSWPMIPNNLSTWILKLSDRLVITAALGVEANATYAVANKIPGLLSIAQSIFVMAWQENASIAVKDKDADRYYSKMFDEILNLMFGCTALLIGFTPVIFLLLIRGDYADAYMQMPILILGMFFFCMSAFQGGLYIAHKKTKSVGMTTTVAAVINLLIDLAMVNRWGITAGSVSTLTAYFFLYIFRIFDSLRFQKMQYNVKKQIIMLIVIIVMLWICYLNQFWLNVANISIGLILFIIFNRSLLKTILEKIVNIKN